MLELSVVVIGKNEAKNLPVSIASLQRLRLEAEMQVEFIYVDSASCDESVDIARKFFDQVIVLDNSFFLCAAAGRFVGTASATKDWVLYLDGDMELSEEFIGRLRPILSLAPDLRGYMGRYEHIYPDGYIKSDGYGPQNNYANNGEIIVKHFGGAVLLPRQLVLCVGNYNPCVFSNEEIDLHTRIRAKGGKVEFVDAKMIRHHTERFSKMTTLLGFYWPTAFLGKKFYGFGQLLASRVNGGNLAGLIKYYPYPFIYWGALVAAAAFWLSGISYLAVLIIVAMMIFVAKFKGARFLVLYPGLLTQTIFGLRKYKNNFVPSIRERYFR